MSVTMPQHHRVGAHRARRNPVAMTLTAVASVVALVAVLGWGLYAAGVVGGGTTKEQLKAANAGASATGDGLATRSGALSTTSAASSSAPAVVPAATTSSAAKPTTSAPTTTAAALNQAATVTVLNGGITTPGVARKLASTLVTKGWTGVQQDLTTNAANYPKVTTTQVLYAKPELAGTATALATLVGAAAPTTSDLAKAGYKTDLVVILGSDFKPIA